MTVLVGPGGLGPAERDEPAEPGVERRTELRAVRAGPGPAVAGRASAASASVLLRAVRPRQWVKNVLVLAAPCAAGVVLHPPVVLACVLALVSFTCGASGCYLINDVVDRRLDRAHPRKRERPVASGALAVPVALAVAGVLLLVGVGVAAAQGTPLLVVLVTYLALTLSYALVLKRLVWLELAVVAVGFVLRAFAGALAAGVVVSTSFLLVVSSAAVLVVASKRASEQLEVPGDPGTVRPVLRRYRPGDLRLARRVAAAVLVVSYLAWAAFRPTGLGAALAVLSAVPLVVVVLRWLGQTERGRTGAPETALTQDRVSRVGVGVWVLIFTATVLVAAASG